MHWGCSVHVGISSVNRGPRLEVVQCIRVISFLNLGGYHDLCGGGIMIYVGDIYHKCIGGYHECIEGCSVHWADIVLEHPECTGDIAPTHLH